jgi:hypothetical protein
MISRNIIGYRQRIANPYSEPWKMAERLLIQGAIYFGAGLGLSLLLWLLRKE